MTVTKDKQFVTRRIYFVTLKFKPKIYAIQECTKGNNQIVKLSHLTIHSFIN